MVSVMKRSALLFKNLVIFLGTFFLIWMIGLYALQNRIIFARKPFQVTPQEVGLNHFDMVSIPTQDGETLVTWYKKPVNEGRVILFLHGSGGSLLRFAPIIAQLDPLSDGVLAIDYRGFGGSTGSPDAEGLYDDALSSMAWLKNKGISSDRIAVAAYSLGTGPAVRIATKEAVSALILMAPYSSIKEVAQSRFPFYPISLLLEENLNAMDDIQNIKAPLLVIHGTEDRVIPWRFGKKLFDAAPEPKKFITLIDGGHRFVYQPNSMTIVGKFLDEYMPSPL